MTLKIIAPAFLLATWFLPMAVASSNPRICPGDSMNATQYSYGSSRPTASGQPFRADGITAAHKTLPLGTKVMVTNPLTGASVVLTINDRGPFTRGRDIDLSQGAARAIGLKDVGTVCTQIQ
jgi:rare lipoprotein A